MITRKLVVVPPVGGGGSSQRFYDSRFLLRNTAVGNDIADMISVYGSGLGYRLTGMLHEVISSDLTIRINKAASPIITFTLPSSTAVGVNVESTTFNSDPQPFTDGEPLTFDVTASDGSISATGIASYMLEWIG